jgi:ubiquitin conjugation factor E4 B
LIISRPAGPAEFLPILLSATSSAPAYDPLTSSTPSASSKNLPLQPDSLPQFLVDLSARFASDTDSLRNILESILSFLFQEFFKAAPPVDLVGGEWRKWIGALEVLVQVKGIAAMVSHFDEQAWVGALIAEFAFTGPEIGGIFLGECKSRAN